MPSFEQQRDTLNKLMGQAAILFAKELTARFEGDQEAIKGLKEEKEEIKGEIDALLGAQDSNSELQARIGWIRDMLDAVLAEVAKPDFFVTDQPE